MDVDAALAVVTNDGRGAMSDVGDVGAVVAADACAGDVGDVGPGNADGVGGSEGWGEGGEGGAEVAMTRKVVRSKRTTSVALHAAASVARCFERTYAFGMSVRAMRDHACAYTRQSIE